MKCPALGAGQYACGDAYPTEAVDGPLTVVSRVDSSNGVNTCSPNSPGSCYSATYSYAGAKADLKGRGFLGFTTVTVADLQTAIIQVTTYATPFPLTGMVLSQVKTHGGAALSTTTNTFYGGTGPCGTAPVPVGRVYTVYLCRTVVSSRDLDGSAMPTVETDYAGHDAYGNVGTVTVSTTPPGGGAADAVKTTVNTWLDIVDAGHWLLGRLTEADATASFTGAPSLTRQSAYGYDPGTGTGSATSTWSPSRARAIRPPPPAPPRATIPS